MSFWKFITHPWAIKLVTKGNRLKLLKWAKEDFISRPLDDQVTWFIDQLKIAIRESFFVREHYPSLLSVNSPEDLLEIPITPTYPEEHYFMPYKKIIFTKVHTGGTSSGKPKTVFLPFTKKTFELIVRLGMALLAISNYGREKTFFDNTLLIAESGLASERYAGLMKLVSKKQTVVLRGRDDLDDFLKKTKKKIDYVIVDMPVTIQFIERYLPRYPDKFSDDLVITSGGGLFIEDHLEIAEEVKSKIGLDFRILNVYASTETMVMGAGMHMVKDNPYSTPAGTVKPIYIDTVLLGAEMTKNINEVPRYPKDYAHRMPNNMDYLMVATMASAFAIPNYFLGDITTNFDGFMRILGRNIILVRDFPFTDKKVYTSAVIRVYGVIIKQGVSKVLETALKTKNFVVLLIPKKTYMDMVIYMDRDPPQNLKERIIEAISRSPEHSYLITDIKEGYIRISDFIKDDRVKQFLDQKREEGIEIYRIYFLEP